MLSFIYTLLVFCLILNGGISAAPVGKPDTNVLLTRQSHSGTATFFFQGGVAGACGQVHSDTDHIVALQTAEFAGGAHCGATITITDTQTGTTATGVAADECPGCRTADSIDLSQGLFEVFAPDSQGTFPASWSFA